MSRRPKSVTSSGDGIKVCNHPGIFKNMCIKCGICMDGIAITTSKSTVQSIAADGPTFKTLTIAGGQQLQLSQEEAIAIQASKSSSLKSQRKLALVLDLDHTLVHSIQVEGPMPSTSAASDEPLPQRNPSVSDIPINDMQCHHLPVEETSISATGAQALRHLLMKKRPFLDRFLLLCSEFCHMIVYTAGTRRYAEAVQKIIDPTRRYFGDRLVSRSDVTGTATGSSNAEPNPNLFINKSLERIFLGDYSMAVILDDREDVWRLPPHGPGQSGSSQVDQLLLVRPYVFFSGQNMVEANNCSGPLNTSGTLSSKPNQANSQSPVIALAGPQPGRLLKMAASFSPEHTEADDQLVRCYDILKAIHAKVYALSTSAVSAAVPSDGKQKLSLPRSLLNIAPSLTLQQPHLHEEALTFPVSTIISEMKSSVLAGCTLTFSGVIPTNESFPEQHILWRLAESLGAQVSVDLLPRTTHLISVHLHTQKVSECLQFRAHDVWVLHPDWLFYCRWSLSRAAEQTFMINALLAGAKYPNPVMNHTPLTPRTLQVRPPIKPEQHPPASRPGPDLSFVQAGAAKKRKIDNAGGSDVAPVILAGEEDGGIQSKRRKNAGYFQVDDEEDGEGYYLHDEDDAKVGDDEGDDDDNEDRQKIYFEFDEQDNGENNVQRIEEDIFDDISSNQQFKSTESFSKLDSDTDSDDFSDFDSFLIDGHVRKK